VNIQQASNHQLRLTSLSIHTTTALNPENHEPNPQAEPDNISHTDKQQPRHKTRTATNSANWHAEQARIF
jgi:hypothetical protein